MKVLLLCKGSLDAIPPIMTVGKVLSELGHDVKIVTSRCAANSKAELNATGICVIEVLPHPTSGVNTTPNKLKEWTTFHHKAWKHIDAESSDRLLWVGTADTALALGRNLLHRRYILQLLELYDSLPHYRYLLGKYARAATLIVVPEMCRAAIFRSWYGLPQTPVVLPNKPVAHPRQANLQINDENARTAFAQISPYEKIVLYQGHIGPDRELIPVAEAINTLGCGWRFVAMGPAYDTYLAKLRVKCPSMIWIPRISPPLHLQITSHAYIGTLQYSYEILNNVFCAPNKIWEYAGFGIPMFCNDLPPLKISIQGTGAGLCTTSWESASIAHTLKQIDCNHGEFSRHAHCLYESVDIRDIIRTTLAAVT